MAWTAEERQANTDPIWVGEERWKAIAREAVRLRDIAGEASVRVLVGEHACLVSGNDDLVVAVVFVKGHPIVKSVARMTRRLIKKPARKQTITRTPYEPPRLASGMF
jgi:hypothetical protein